MALGTKAASARRPTAHAHDRSVPGFIASALWPSQGQWRHPIQRGAPPRQCRSFEKGSESVPLANLQLAVRGDAPVHGVPVERVVDGLERGVRRDRHVLGAGVVHLDR
jgi:hypothetical protein